MIVGMKLIVVLIAMLVFSNVIPAVGDYGATKAYERIEVESREELLQLAYDIATVEKIDVNDCDVEVTERIGSIEVKFIPRKRQMGGGGKLSFKEENGKYRFVKIQLWQ